MTINGKIDVKKLPSISSNLVEPVWHEGNRDYVEISVMKCFSAVLHVPLDIIECKSGFFQLGGDSIKAIQLANAIKSDLGYSIKVQEIFELKTPFNIAKKIRELSQVTCMNEQGELKGDVPYLPIQKWYLSEINMGDFNQVFAIKLPKKYNMDKLEKAIVNLINYHDCFRLRVKGSKQHYTEYISNIKIHKITIEDDKIILREPFDLNATLFRFILNETTNNLIIMCHHMIIDRVSWDIIVGDLKKLYMGEELPSKGTSYRQWGEFLENSEEVELGNVTEFDRYEELRGNAVSSKRIKFDERLTSRILGQIGATYNTSIDIVLLTVLARTMSCVIDEDEFHVTLEHHGRSHNNNNIDISRTVGWFTTMYPQKVSTCLVKTKRYVYENKGKEMAYAIKYGLNSEKMPAISFNYLGSVNNLNKKTTCWQIVEDNAIESPKGLDSLLSINSWIINGELNIDFSGNIRNIQEVVIKYEEELNFLVKEIENLRRTYLTVEDLSPCVPLSQEDLDKLQKDVELEGIFCASDAQKGMIYSLLNDNFNDEYICSLKISYSGKMNINTYRKSWELALQKYPALRISFNWEYGRILQVIPKYKNLNWKMLYNRKCSDVLLEERSTKFDFVEGNLIKVSVIEYPNYKYVCIVTLHHSIMDGWSNSILLDFIHKTYATLEAGKVLNENSDRAYLEAQSYLSSYLDSTTDSLEKIVHPDLGGLFKEEVRGIRLEEINVIEKIGSEEIFIEGEDYSFLADFIKKEELTYSVMVQYAWHKVLSIYGGITNTTVGVVNAGRNIPVEGVEDSIGLYIRTIPIQMEHKEQLIIDQLKELQKLNTINIDGIKNNIKYVDEHGNRAFSTIYVYENFPVAENRIGCKIGDLILEDFSGVEKTDYPCVLTAYESNQRLVVKLTYDESLFAIDRIKDLMKLMKRIIMGIPQERNDYGDWLEPLESQYKETTMVDMFEEAVQKYPKNIALKFRGYSCTYEELNECANIIANSLINDFGISVGDRVSIQLERNMKMIHVVLGILKAGAVYVPIRPDCPKERSAYICKKVNSSITIDNEFFEKMKHIDKRNPQIVVKPDYLAYVMFTSGTTGYPKGVMVEHRHFVSYIDSLFKSLNEMGHGDVDLACISDYAFDIFGTEVFGQLFRGKTVHLFSGIPEEFPTFIESSSVTGLQGTPSKIEYLISIDEDVISYSHIKVLLVGGERMNAGFLEKFKHLTIINIYGPTEGTVWTSLKKVQNNLSVIGVPFAGYWHMIMDDYGRLLPSGAVGELCISGPQLSRGYYGDKDLTDKSFVVNPYNLKHLEAYNLLYKTGDLARILPNGELELLGRRDFQVKIRGFRIELGEIESVMLEIPQIKQTLAVVFKDKKGTEHIGVYYTSNGQIAGSEIYKILDLYLPNYMIPSAVNEIKHFPLTVNGKIDRNKLPNFKIVDNEIVAPSNEIEGNLIRIFANLLDLNKEVVSATANFFKIGGDSTKVIQLIKTIKDIYSVDVTVKDIFIHKTVRNIAELVSIKNKSLSKDHFIQCYEKNENNEYPLSFAQKNYLTRPMSTYNNVKIDFKIKKHIDVDRLVRSVRKVVERHEVLRTKIYRTHQKIEDVELEITCNKIDKQQYLSHQFKLDQEIPIKVNIYANEFTCVIDHIAFDGWSTHIFLKEIEDVYEGKNMQELPYQYKDYSIEQNNFLSTNKANLEIEYWKGEFKKYSPHRILEHKEAYKGGVVGADIHINIETGMYEKIKAISKEESVTLHNLLLAVFYLTLSRVSGQSAVSIVIPTYNRNQPGSEKLIGLFINQMLLPMTDIVLDDKFSFVRRVHHAVIEGQDYQELPFEYLIDKCELEYKGEKIYFGVQGFKSDALKKSNLFESASHMNQPTQKDAFCDLTLFVWGRTLNFNYNCQKFDESFIKKISAEYMEVLKEICDADENHRRER
ncbi:condensation domain-containing protein [Aerococcaceae bacterium NML191292]|nr:condensation domain-containing protein [Aerococcaceae bacterium NML191292]